MHLGFVDALDIGELGLRLQLRLHVRVRQHAAAEALLLEQRAEAAHEQERDAERAHRPPQLPPHARLSLRPGNQEWMQNSLR